MEVVPTGDGDDDGVVWFRCPQCQGFLPKLSALTSATAPPPGAGIDSVGPAEGTSAEAAAAYPGIDGDEMVGEAAFVPDDADEPGIEDDDDGDEADGGNDGSAAAAAAFPEPARGPLPEPVHEYAAMLAATDPALAVPYRPWETYAVGQCVLHLAWNDGGVVVAKESLPGGRQVIKCWFQGAGVVRLIENAPR